ncbi:hypothetical protein DET49_13023 [Salegentibacter sp. 24]|nr:hypothetical protein DET49_13023 [Salegentibacter sp. 24]
MLLFILTGTSLQASTDYECAISGMNYYPIQQEISLNPQILIQGYAMDQKTIRGFEELPPYLETESGEKVMLELLAINEGQMSLTQAIFKPVTSLKPNTDYYLNFQRAKQNEKEDPTRYNSEKKERERIIWSTTNTKDLKPMDSELEITFDKTNVEWYGCGPEANALFKINNTKGQEIWYRTEFVDLETGKSSTYILNTWKDKLYVGHGMCSGAFTYAKTGKYKVRFTPMNIDGKISKTTKWFTYESPFVGEENPWGFRI